MSSSDDETDESNREESSSTQSSSLSLMDRLCSPTPSDLGKKRVTKRNPPRNANRIKPPRQGHNTKTISPARVAQYKDEPFVVSRGKLFCQACQEELGLKQSVIDNHVNNSKKHSAGKDRLASKGQQEQDIIQALEAYNSKEHPVGEALPPEQQVYRVKVTEPSSGIPISKLDQFRELLEENGLRLAGRRTMSDSIPFVQQEEQKRVRKEIDKRKVSIVFDGTTRHGEAMATAVRFIDGSWEYLSTSHSATALGQVNVW